MTPENPPNIVLINSHDSGRFFGCYGIPSVCSPHLDRLAQQGVLFENMTAASPICSPSRGAMVTGRWPQRNGLLGLTHHGFRFNPGERHMAAILKDAGYSTVLFHFQHVAEKSEWRELGFEHYLAQSKDEEEPVYPNMARPAEEVANAFSDFLHKRETDRPFFCQINFNETHTPYTFGGVTPDTERGVTVPGWLETDAAAQEHFAWLQGSVKALDMGIGIILEALRARSLEQNTIVLFATDHGLEAARDKWSCYEAGLGIAAIIRYPAADVTGGRRLAQPVSNVDILPTLLDLAGLKIPDNLDGMSLASALHGESELDPERPVFGIYHNSGIRSVRLGDWKLILNLCSEPYREAAPVNLHRIRQAHPRPPVELYNLHEDPDELCNLATRHPDRVNTLKHTLRQWMQNVNDPACLPV